MPDITDLRLRPSQLTNVFAAVRPGRYMLGTATTAITTYSGITTLQAGDAFFWQQLIPNLGPAYSAKVSYAVIAAAGGDTSVSTRTTDGVTWSAAETVAVAAGGTSAGLNAETVVFTPSAGIGRKTLVRTDSPTRARCLVAWRVQVPSGVQPTIPANAAYYWRLENQLWPMMKTSTQAVAGVDTPANVTSVATVADGGEGFYVGIKYMSSKFGKQLLIGGDSIAEGLGGDARFWGGAQRAAANLSTPDVPYEFFNAAQHAQTPDVYTANLVQNFALAAPTIVIYCPYSINQITKSATSPGLTTAIKEECYRGLASLARITTGHRAQVFISDCLPNAIYSSSDGNGATTGAADVTGRQAFNTELASYGSNPSPALTSGAILKRQGWTLIQPGAAWSDPTAIAGGQIVPKAASLGTDRTHPNEAGYTGDFMPTYQPFLAAA